MALLLSLTSLGRGNISCFLELQVPKGGEVENIHGIVKCAILWKPGKYPCLLKQHYDSEVLAIPSAWVSWRGSQWGQITTLSAVTYLQAIKCSVSVPWLPASAHCNI